MSRGPSSGSPATSPSTMTVSWGPWNSTAVRKRSMPRIVRRGGVGAAGLGPSAELMAPLPHFPQIRTHVRM